MTYRLSKSAESGLFDIWRYSVETWGEAQAEKYLRQLEVRFLDLAENPAIGRARDELAPGYLSFREACHVIFYTRYKEGIAIARVLHERMDLSYQLGKDPGTDES